ANDETRSSRCHLVSDVTSQADKHLTKVVLRCSERQIISFSQVIQTMSDQQFGLYFAGRSLSVGKKIRKLLVRRAGGSFSNVRRNRHGRSSELRSQPKSLFLGEGFSDFVNCDDKINCLSPYIQFFVGSHDL